MKHLFEGFYFMRGEEGESQVGTAGSAENERDEFDILSNQDETDPGSINEDDSVMGAGPTDRFSAAETGEFARGEVDVVDQMKRAERAIEFPNRAAAVKTT